MGVINFRKIDSHPADAVRFFKIMMRLEYALKAIAFARMSRDALEICWDRFANERVGAGLFKTIRDSGRANTLIDEPPSHQVIDTSGTLDFRPAGQVQSVQELLAALRRVRNNLFHGGKSGDVDHNRNDALIAEAIYVITEILLADDQLRAKFEGND